MRWEVIMIELEQVGGFSRTAADGTRKPLSNFCSSYQSFVLMRQHKANPAVAWRLQQERALARMVEQQVAAAHQIQIVPGCDAARIQQLAYPGPGCVHHPVERTPLAVHLNGTVRRDRFDPSVRMDPNSGRRGFFGRP